MPHLVRLRYAMAAAAAEESKALHAQQAQHAKGRMHVVMHCMEELVWVAAQEEQRRVQQLQSFCSCFIVRSVGV
jgi:hypothetical protein